MLHIDFGFILGKDPKMGAPPFKLSPDMVEGLRVENNKDLSKNRNYDDLK